MRYFHTLLISCLTWFSASSQTAVLKWATQLKGDQICYPAASDVDSSGNVYVTGGFMGTVDFDPGPGTYTMTSFNAGSYDFFMCKLGPSGNLVWAFSLGNNLNDIGLSLVVDDSSNIYITGEFGNVIDFDPGSGTYTVSSKGLADIFVCKYNSAGNLKWAKGMGSVNNDLGFAITLDNSRNVITTGYFLGFCDFDPGPSTYTLFANTDDPFISKLDPSGNFVWAKSIDGSSGSDYGWGIAADSLNNIYSTGEFRNTSDFDPGPGTLTVTSNGFADIYIQKLDPNGNLVWAKTMGGPQQDGGNAIAIGPGGNVYSTGYFNQTVDFDPGASVFNMTSLGFKDIYISKLSSSGNFIYSKQLGGSSDDISESIVIDRNSNIYSTGYFGGTCDFDPGSGTYSLTAGGTSYDSYVSKLDQAGNFVYAVQTTGNGNEQAFDISLGDSSSIYLAGEFFGVADFDPGPAVASFTGSSANDGFVLKLKECTPPANPVNVSNPSNLYACEGNTIQLNASATGTVNWYPSYTSTSSIAGGTIYNSYFFTAGNYTYYANATNNCTSSDKTPFTFTILPAPNINVSFSSFTVCAGQTATMTASGASTYTWSTGSNSTSIVVSPTTSTNYTVNGTNSFGCISTFTANLFVFSCTGIAEQYANEFSGELFPNPNNGSFYLQLKDITDHFELQIINELGISVFSQKISEKITKIDPGILSKGIYLLLVNNDGQQVFKARMVIE